MAVGTRKLGARWVPLVGILVAAAATAALAQVPAGTEPSALENSIERLRADVGDAARVTLQPATGTVRWVVLPPAKTAPGTAVDVEARSLEFLTRYKELFGLVEPATELRRTKTMRDRLGETHVEYRQSFHGLPVFGTMLKVHFAADGSLRAVNGAVVPTPELSPTPAIEADRAASIARDDLASRVDGKHVVLSAPRLLVFRENLVRGIPGATRLAWEVEVGDGAAVGEHVYVDAHKGSVLDRISTVHEIIDRRIFDGGFEPEFVVWTEGSQVPFGDPDIDNLIAFTKHIYNAVASMTGGAFLSWDGQDATMNAVNDSPNLACPNASWRSSSQTTNFCLGVTGDDTVGHEWAHAYTDATHDLIYAWQPGALNESYSDIWGELIDLLNGTGTDAPAPIRGDEECSTFGGAPPPAFDIVSPMADSIGAAGATYNPPGPATVQAPLVLVDDGDVAGEGGTVTDACSPLVGFPAGSIALVDRGVCTFVTKTLNVQAAGAVAMVMINNADSIFAMGGSTAGVGIPSVMIKLSDGESLKAQIDELGEVTGKVATFVATESSYRWLAGEDSTAFGRVIRDMWHPVCLGDPGRVGDAFYTCSSGDNGGVHSNSGVPNHAFALLVDGGVYNGQSIQGIGLTDAIHIYWRAQTVYQTPISDFTDHADALQASCIDLIAAPLLAPITEEPDPVVSSFTITPDDCDELDKVIDATELRIEPDCDFQPLLAQGAPAVCDGGPEAQIARFDFESGWQSWINGSREVLNTATHDSPDWQLKSELPDSRPGTGVFGANLVIGDCDEDMESSVRYIESPDIVVSSGVIDPRMAFDHWLATEKDYDGGNVKISVNGGVWQIVPVEAFLFNPYNLDLRTAEQGNTNPMAGESAFSGADDGSVSGSWGQSRIDLSGLAVAGDTVRIRFELGQDGCNGRIGWYLDDVSLYGCTCEGELVPFEWFADADADGFGDPGSTLHACKRPDGYSAIADDCNDRDGTVWGLPGEATDLRFDIDRQTLTWQLPADPGGSAPVSDLLRTDDPRDWVSSAVCVASDAAATTAVDDSVPALGRVWFYLARIKNACAEGSIGSDSSLDPRPARTCP